MGLVGILYPNPIYSLNATEIVLRAEPDINRGLAEVARLTKGKRANDRKNPNST